MFTVTRVLIIHSNVSAEDCCCILYHKFITFVYLTAFRWRRGTTEVNHILYLIEYYEFINHTRGVIQNTTKYENVCVTTVLFENSSVLIIIIVRININILTTRSAACINTACRYTHYTSMPVIKNTVDFTIMCIKNIKNSCCFRTRYYAGRLRDDGFGTEQKPRSKLPS